MLLGIWMHEHHVSLPEWVTGLIGMVLLLLSLMDSLRHRRRAGLVQMPK